MLEREKHQAESAKFDSYFAPSAVVPYVEVVPHKVFKRDIGAHVKTYIGIVGVQPEDMFAIYTEPEFEGRGDLNIVYRDRPEYEEGRRRYRLVIRGEGDQLTVLS
jgi:hypothetical protein